MDRKTETSPTHQTVYLHQSGYPQPQNINTPPDEGWCALNHRNKPQANSIGAGSCIIVTGGMSIAWSMRYGDNADNTTYMLICWFVMSIVGALFGAALTNVLKKKLFVMLTAVLVITGGILFVSCSNSFAAIMVARHLNGFAVGCLLIPTLVMSGEEAIKELRGMNTSSVDVMSFNLGLFLQIIYGFTKTNRGFLNLDLDSNQLHGILLIVFGFLSLAIGYYFVVESPVFYLLHNQELEAIASLQELQRPFVVTTETYVLLEEHKQYVAANKGMTLPQILVASLSALFALSIFRGISALTFSATLNVAFTTAYNASIGDFAWPVVLYGFCRCTGTIIAVYLQDSVGRKMPIIVGMVSSGGLAIALGYIFNDMINTFNYYEMIQAYILFIIYELCVGIALASSSTYLTEAFPLAVKPYCIAIAFIVEMLMHIICITSVQSIDSFANYFIALGSISLVFVVFTTICLPETKNLTLLEAQVEFSKFQCFKSNDR